MRFTFRWELQERGSRRLNVSSNKVEKFLFQCETFINDSMKKILSGINQTRK